MVCKGCVIFSMEKVSKGSGGGGERMLFMILCMYVCESVSCIADGFSSHQGVTFETTILDKFKVACGHEGETLSLGCTVIIYPTVKNYTPEVVWYKNGELTHFWGSALPKLFGVFNPKSFDFPHS